MLIDKNISILFEIDVLIGYTHRRKEKQMPINAKNSKRSAHRLTNYMEELAGSVLTDLLKEKSNKRFTPEAIEDIKALALNRLWPMYTTSDSGRDFLKKAVVEDKIEKDILRELRAAMSIVRSHPRK